MSNIATNPWSFVPGDIATAPITAATGLTLNPDSTVTITVTAPLTFIADLPQVGFTVIAPANLLYQGFYKLITGASGDSSFIMAPQFAIPVGTAASGSGNIAQVQYRDNERIEDMSWQNQAAAGNQLIVYDRNGFLLWSATASSAGFQNRGKVYWCHGFAILQMDSGTLLVTIN